MCTLACLRQPGGYILWHSRDERRSRAPGLPPRVERQGGVRWLAPVDSEAGGTWVGVNDAGLSVGVANLFVTAPPLDPRHKVSRGLLVRSLLALRSPARVAAAAREAELSRYEPFTLVAVSREVTLILEWNRTTLRPVEPLGAVLLVSSAGGHREIVEARRRLFTALEERGSSPESVEALYRAAADPGGNSITVDYPEVSTMSLARIEVGARDVSLTYTPGPPSRTPAGARVTLSDES